VNFIGPGEDEPEHATLSQMIAFERAQLTENPWRRSFFNCGCPDRPCDAAILKVVAPHAGTICPNEEEVKELEDRDIPY
jgi:hypothetical protein